SPESAPLLREIMKSETPDVVHIHGLFSHLTMLAPRICAAADVPYVMRPAGGLNAFCRAQGNKSGKDIMFRMFVKHDMEGAEFIHATSEREKDELKLLFPSSRIEVIPHGVTIPSETELELARANFLVAYPQLASRPFILYLSRIHRKKRLDLVIRAMAQPPLDNMEFMLVIAGADAGFREEAELFAAQLGLANRMLFTGFLDGEVKSGAFAAAKVFVLTSEDENFGAAAVEALAHGTPALLTRGVDAHIYIDAANAGLTVHGEVDDINRGIVSLVNADRDDIAKRGRDYAGANLSWRNVATRLGKLYNEDSDA
ncbi:MAG: glycosyltransferase, partial [Candidatus Sumerlaeota bacterium]